MADDIPGESPLFDGALPAVQHQLSAEAVLRTFPPRAPVFQQGEAADSLFVLRSGLVHMVLGPPTGKRVATGLYSRRGDVLWHAPLLRGGVRFASAITLAPTELFEIKNEVVARALKAHPKIALNLVSIAEDQLMATLDWIERQEFRELSYRIAWAAWSLASRLGRDTAAGTELRAPVEQADLAALAGVSREVFNRVLKQLGPGFPVQSSRAGITVDLAAAAAIVSEGRERRRRTPPRPRPGPLSDTPDAPGDTGPA